MFSPKSRRHARQKKSLDFPLEKSKITFVLAIGHGSANPQMAENKRFSRLKLLLGDETHKE
jgi:hypothetical protein